MAYFYCGTEAADYEEHYCFKCIHGQDPEKGCPVFQAHWLYSYELCNKKEDPGKIILDMLIPDGKHGPAKCLMFQQYVEPPPGPLERGETPLFGEEG